MTNQNARNRVILCILDGWGWRPEIQNNAIAKANTPNYDRLVASCPHALIETSGAAVGLPDGQMGNSEVGHTNIGAGRVVLQDLPRIDHAIETGEIEHNKELDDLVRHVSQTGGAVHLLGLLSPGGVHSHQDHIATLANLIAKRGIDVWIHAFLDGRDTPPQSADGFLRQFLEAISQYKNIRVATVCGRYYGMDRDNRWDRTERAYNALIDAAGETKADTLTAIQDAYTGGITDEFVEPVTIDGYQGMKDGDGLIMCNFRADRARQMAHALLDEGFDGFARQRKVQFSAAKGMVSYSSALDPLLPMLFPPATLTNTLGECVAKAGLSQLRLAETEKYAHVTFFLNGGRETVYENEERLLIQSPKVATYDLQPEMSAPEVTDRLVDAIESAKFDLIVVNFANPDMVGHTGIMEAAIKAVETIDDALGRVHMAAEKSNSTLLITADHGNVELMRDPVTDAPHTAHTSLPVPLVMAGRVLSDTKLKNGCLADLAPTILSLLKIEQPAEMTGQSLLETVDAKDTVHA